jgi:hypothetical protein
MKGFITILAAMMFVLTGCFEDAKVETPPWSDRQQEQMEDDNIETIPFAIFRF